MHESRSYYVTATGAGSQQACPTLQAVSDARVQEIVDRLRLDGGRVTLPRRLVIEAMVRSPSHHLTASEVVDAVRADDPEFYESTVYRTLDRLLELGIIERVRIGPGAAAVYHLPHRPHHHLVCEGCGAVIEASAGLLDTLAKRVRTEHGFTLRPSASVLIGSCERCEAAASASP